MCMINFFILCFTTKYSLCISCCTVTICFILLHLYNSGVPLNILITFIIVLYVSLPIMHQSYRKCWSYRCVGVNCKRVLVTVTVTVGSKLVDWIPAEKIVCVYVHVRLICTKVTVSYLTLNLHHYIMHVKQNMLGACAHQYNKQRTQQGRTIQTNSC